MTTPGFFAVQRRNSSFDFLVAGKHFTENGLGPKSVNGCGNLRLRYHAIGEEQMKGESDSDQKHGSNFAVKFCLSEKAVSSILYALKKALIIAPDYYIIIMQKESKKLVIRLSIISLYILVVGVFVYAPYDNLFSLMIRLFALLGYVSMSIAALMTPFAVELYKIFGKSFIRTHHFFAILGLILITLHPVAVAIQTANLLVFLPSFDSWIIFWELAGRPALILIYIGVAAGFLRNVYKKFWKQFHALLYIALFFGLTHGTLIGLSFKNIFIMIIFYTLFLLVMLAFIYKRYRNFGRKGKVNTA